MQFSNNSWDTKILCGYRVKIDGLKWFPDTLTPDTSIFQGCVCVFTDFSSSEILYSSNFRSVVGYKRKKLGLVIVIICSDIKLIHFHNKKPRAKEINRQIARYIQSYKAFSYNVLSIGDLLCDTYYLYILSTYLPTYLSIFLSSIWWYLLQMTGQNTRVLYLENNCYFKL